MNPRSASVWAALSLIAVGVAAGLWYLSSRSNRHEPAVGAHEARSLTVVQKAQLRAFSLLRSQPEQVPPRVRAHIVVIAGGRIGDELRFEDAQYTHTPLGGIWVVSGRNATCLAQAGQGSLACGSTANSVQNGIALGTFKPPKIPTERPHSFLVLGIVPDGVKAVDLKVGAAVRTVPVRDNAYALHANVPIKVVKLDR